MSGTLDSLPQLPADTDTVLILVERPAVIVNVIVKVPLWPHFRYVASLETFEELEAASALALRYGQLSESVLTALASDASDETRCRT